MKAFFRLVCPGWNIEIETRKIAIFIYGLEETRENEKKKKNKKREQDSTRPRQTHRRHRKAVSRSGRVSS